MARFVGADRGLKRLSLTRVRDLDLQAVAIAHAGDPAGPARDEAMRLGFPYILVVDSAGRPDGWLDAGRLAPDAIIVPGLAIASSPLLAAETTLKDALSMMLEAEVQAGIVVDRAGRPLGLVTLDAMGLALRGPTDAASLVAPAATDGPVAAPIVSPPARG